MEAGLPAHGNKFASSTEVKINKLFAVPVFV